MLEAFAVAGGRAARARAPGRAAPRQADRLAEARPRAHRAAGRRLARPAHPAGRHQGGGLHACVSADVDWLAEDEAELLEAIEESADRLDAPHRQPARPVPAADRQRARRATTGRASRRWCRCAVRAVRPGDRVRSTSPDDLPLVAHRRRPARPGGRQPRRERPAAHRGAPVVVALAASSATGWRSGSSTAAPACPTTPRSACSRPFQRLGDAPPGRASGSGSPSPAGSTEAMGGDARPPRTPPAAGSPWCWRCRRHADPAGPLPEAGRRDPRARRRRRARDRAHAGDQPAGPRLRGRHRRATAARPSTPRPSDTPDVVMLDLGLPDLDGIEVLARAARLDRRAGHRAVRAARVRRQGRGARRSAPTTTSPSRSAWTSCWPGCGPPCDARPPRPSRPAVGRDRRLHRRPRGASGSSATASEVRLTPTEWRLLEVAGPQPGRLVVRSSSCCSEVWGPAYDRETNYLRVYVAQLRRKLEADPVPPAPPPHRARHGLPLRTLT